MSRKLYLLLSMFFITNLIQAEQQYLVSYELVKQHTKSSIDSIWKAHKIPKFVLPVKNDVDIYEVIYLVPWIDSTMRKASAIVYIPRNTKKTNSFSIMMYGHGTEIHKDRTISDNNAQQGICLGFAADGYIALHPDYYGLGKGEGKHLYQHAWSEAMSYIYLLYAFDELKDKINTQYDGQLFLTGYSQGGHSSFAAQKYLEALNDPRFQVTASSPMSGAYNMVGEQEKYMFQEYPRPFYLPFLLISYQEAYHIIDTDNIYEIFRSPLDTLLPKFFENNKNLSYGELDKALPKIPKDIVKQEYIDEYLNNPNFEFKLRLKENSLDKNWVAKAPTQLCFCKGDREVHYSNSIDVYNEMTKKGKDDIILKNLSDHLDHNTCAAFAVLATKYYFDRFKNKGKNPKMKAVPKFKQFLMNFVKKKEEKKYLAEGKDNARY